MLVGTKVCIHVVFVGEEDGVPIENRPARPGNHKDMRRQVPMSCFSMQTCCQIKIALF